MVDETDSFSSDKLKRSTDYYINDLNEHAGGPQYSGLIDEKFVQASLDSRSLFVELEGAEVVWPLIVPIEYNIDYRSEFFTEHFGDHEAFFLTLPASESVSDEVVESLVERAASMDSPMLLAFDVCGDDRKALYERFITRVAAIAPIQDVTPDSEAFGSSYGQPKVIHFSSTLTGKNQESGDNVTILSAIHSAKEKANTEKIPADGATILTEERLSEEDGALLNEIWSIYEEQFEQLVEDHPSLQIQPKDELFKMLLDPSSLNIACFEDGRVAALTYFVTNIASCVWLKEDYFATAQKDNEQTVYFPGIVVRADKARQGADYVSKMLNVANEVIFAPGVTQDLKITFQCTNVSATYIPKIVSDFVEQSVKEKYSKYGTDEKFGIFSPIAEYDYKVVSVG